MTLCDDCLEMVPIVSRMKDVTGKKLRPLALCPACACKRKEKLHERLQGRSI